MQIISTHSFARINRCCLGLDQLHYMRETDIGITGGGNGKHMVYLSGVTDHHVEVADMVAHIVKLVEAKAAAIDAGEAVSADDLHGVAA